MKNTAYRGDLSAPRELTPFKPPSAVAPAGTPGAAASSIDPAIRNAAVVSRQHQPGQIKPGVLSHSAGKEIVMKKPQSPKHRTSCSYAPGARRKALRKNYRPQKAQLKAAGKLSPVLKVKAQPLPERKGRAQDSVHPSSSFTAQENLMQNLKQPQTGTNCQTAATKARPGYRLPEALKARKTIYPYLSRLLKGTILAATAVTLALTILPGLSEAANLPVFDKHIHGNATITEMGPYMSIDGHKANNVLQWKSFDVGKRNTVDFQNGNFLNLVRDHKASRIEGMLTGTGSVFIVNPHGINLAKGSRVQVDHFGLSTAKVSAKMLKSFIASPVNDQWTTDNRPLANFTFSDGKGMGKVRLLGDIETIDLLVDGGQILIRDANRLTDLSHQPLQGEHAVLQSSVNRIDAGFVSPEQGTPEQVFDLGTQFEIKNLQHDTVISHQGELALADESDLDLIAKHGTDGSYWLADNIETTKSIAAGQTFSGSLDGAYNRISYSIKAEPDASSAGLFTALDGAEIKNLLITDSTLDLSATSNGGIASGTVLKAGGLAATIKDSKLTDVEVDKLNLLQPAEDSATLPSLKTGSLSAELGGTTQLENVSAGFAAASAQALAALTASAPDKVTAGAVTAEISGTLHTAGLNAGTNGADGLAATATNHTTTALADSIADGIAAAQANGQSLADYAVNESTDEAHLKGFMQPYFVENFDYVYDGSGHDYQDLNSVHFTGTTVNAEGQSVSSEHEVFSAQDLISFDNQAHSPDGKVTAADNYHYELTNTKGFDGFYLVQPDQADGTAGEQTLGGSGYINIAKRDLGTIVISDETVTAGETASPSITNAADLNFAPGESLEDFNGQAVLPQDYSTSGNYEIGFSAAGLDENYTYKVDKGELKVNAKPEPQPEPEPEPLPEVDPPAPIKPANPNTQTAVVEVFENVAPCNYCSGRDQAALNWNEQGTCRLNESLPGEVDGNGIVFASSAKINDQSWGWYLSDELKAYEAEVQAAIAEKMMAQAAADALPPAQQEQAGEKAAKPSDDDDAQQEQDTKARQQAHATTVPVTAAHIVPMNYLRTYVRGFVKTVPHF